jgi:hypothetical protein
MRKDACKVDCLKAAREGLASAAVWLDRAAKRAEENNQQTDRKHIVEARQAIHRIIEAMADRYRVGKLDTSNRIWTS